MDYKDFIKRIGTNKLRPVYLFTGDEEYLILDVIERLKKEYIEDNFEALNYINIASKENSFDSILNACETLPFMSEKKLIGGKDKVWGLRRDG